MASSDSVYIDEDVYSRESTDPDGIVQATGRDGILVWHSFLDLVLRAGVPIITPSEFEGGGVCRILGRGATMVVSERVLKASQSRAGGGDQKQPAVVAVKQLIVRFADSEDYLRARPQHELALLANFTLELRALCHGALRSHVNIVRLLGITWAEKGLPALIVERASEYVPALQSLIENRKLRGVQKADVLAGIADGLSAIHVGIDHTGFAEMVLRSVVTRPKSKIGDLRSFMEKPLFQAVVFNRMPLARWFISDWGADPVRQNKDGETILSLMAWRNSFHAVKYILELRGASKMIENRSFLGEGPIRLASAKGNSRIVKMLLDAGASPTGRKFLDQTVLHLCASLVNKRAFCTLVDHIEQLSPSTLRAMMNHKNSNGGVKNSQAKVYTMLTNFVYSIQPRHYIDRNGSNISYKYANFDPLAFPEPDKFLLGRLVDSHPPRVISLLK